MTPYNEFKAFVNSLPVANDEVERVVILIKDYIGSIQVENSRQDLLFAIQLKKKKTHVIKVFKKKKVASSFISSLN